MRLNYKCWWHAHLKIFSGSFNLETLCSRHLSLFACPASEIWFLHLENFLSQLSYRTSSCFSTIAVNMVSTCFHSLLWSWNTGTWRTALYFRLETSVSRKDLQWPCWSPQSDRGWGRGTDGGVLVKHLRWSSADSIGCVAWFDGLDPLKLCNPSASLSS